MKRRSVYFFMKFSQPTHSDDTDVFDAPDGTVGIEAPTRPPRRQRRCLRTTPSSVPPPAARGPPAGMSDDDAVRAATRSPWADRPRPGKLAGLGGALAEKCVVHRGEEGRRGRALPDPAMLLGLNSSTSTRRRPCKRGFT